jgi:hypothetical protein
MAPAIFSRFVKIIAVSLSEIYVGDADPSTAADRIRNWGVKILDVPAAAADVCAKAYLRYQRPFDILMHQCYVLMHENHDKIKRRSAEAG